MSRLQRRLSFGLLLALPKILTATLIGNPGQPSIQPLGVIWEKPKWWNVRVSYIGDYVYKQRFHATDGSETSQKRIKLWTQAGMFTLNFRDRLDLYAITGGLRLQVEQELITRQQFAWGFGGKLIFFHSGRFRLGCDFKYFQSDQSPYFFQEDNLAYNIISNFHYDYNEMQAALGISYRTKYFSPYVNGTYLIAKLDPKPPQVDVRLPMMNMDVEVIAQTIKSSRRFGMAIGATIIDQKKATLAIEWRAFNQNSIDVTGELRF